MSECERVILWGLAAYCLLDNLIGLFELSREEALLNRISQLEKWDGKNRRDIDAMLAELEKRAKRCDEQEAGA